MSIKRISKALYWVWKNCDFGASHGSAGVWIFKLVKVNPFDVTAGWHDKQYSLIDWKIGSGPLDAELLKRFMVDANGDQDLIDVAIVLYSLARTYGKLRFGLAKIGICWSTTKGK